MSHDWDARYRDKRGSPPRDPHQLLASFWTEIPQGPILDIAMGTGQDSIFLATRGRTVYGLDRSEEAVRQARRNSVILGQTFNPILGDATDLSFKPGSLAGVTVFYFLVREILPGIVGILQRGGVLIYETFLLRQNVLDRERNPLFLLKDGEMYRTLTETMDVLFYEETISFSRGRKRAIMQYVGRKR